MFVSDTFVLWFGVVLASVHMLYAVPQALRVWKHRDNVQGVSLGMWSLNCLGCTSWLIYGVKVHSLALVLSNVLPVISTVLIVYWLSRSWPKRSTLMALGCASVSVLIFTPAVIVAIIGTILSIVCRIPQMIESMKNASRQCQTNVSKATYILSVGEAPFWCLYAIWTDDTPLLVATMIIATCSMLILVPEIWNPANRQVKVG